jgi:hypothetical protein
MGELARKLHELDGVSSRVEQLLRQDFPVLAPTASSCFIIMYIQIVVGRDLCLSSPSAYPLFTPRSSGRSPKA